MSKDIRPHPCPSPGHAGLFMAGCLRGRGFTGKNGLSGEKTPRSTHFCRWLHQLSELKSVPQFFRLTNSDQPSIIRSR
jgi:hypothetical protein